jgi:DNA-binding GntR family transcriptional regulator
VIHSLVEQMHTELKERILSGRWHLGSRVYEQELAAEVGLSRAPVREAIRLLEQEGLVVRHPHRGLFVANPSPEEILDVAAVRALLESSAVRWAGGLSAAALDDLEAMCAQMDRASQAGNRLEAVLADLSFHGRIIAASENRVLRRKFHELDGYEALFFHAVLDRKPERLHGLGDRHRAIIQALAAGDPPAIEATIRDHYEGAARLLQHIRGDDPHV